VFSKALVRHDAASADQGPAAWHGRRLAANNAETEGNHGKQLLFEATVNNVPDLGKAAR
jgi:hypothetical protein